jgi:aspartate kinase
MADALSGPVVHKFGGSCLSSPELTLRCADIVKEALAEGNRQFVVISALKGQTNLIREELAKLVKGENGLDHFIEEVRARHLLMAESTIVDRKLRAQVVESLDTLATRLERLLWGVVYTEELTPRTADQALTHGERMAAYLFAGVLRGKGLDAVALEADMAGVVTDGVYGAATANLEATQVSLGDKVRPILERKGVPVLTGFFGADMQGHTTTFGRNGSDYSAAVAARALSSPLLVLWKDVPGFMSADPKVVKGARLLPLVTYEEAAELAYFGLEVLHPMTVEPLLPLGIPIQIRDLMDPKGPGSLISARNGTEGPHIKSVTRTTGISIIKVHAAALGIRPGFLAAVTKTFADQGVQALGVSTSQACLGVVLRTKDADKAVMALRGAAIPELERIDRTDELALIGAVGSGALQDQTVTTRMMSALAGMGGPIASVAVGPSSAAVYFVVDESISKDAVLLVHRTFCES